MKTSHIQYLKKNRKTNKKGFTMLELLMVVIVVGILASLAIPKYQDFTEKAIGAEAFRAITAIRKLIVMDIQEHDTLNVNRINNSGSFPVWNGPDHSQFWQYQAYPMDALGLGGNAWIIAVRSNRDNGSNAKIFAYWVALLDGKVIRTQKYEQPIGVWSDA